jgi:hypothetical protein
LFYTYAHYKKDNNSLFYIGKGSGNRYLSKNRGQHWHNVVAKHGLDTQILAHWNKVEEAFEHEKLLISCFRELGHNLINQTDGGNGISGNKRSAETKEKLAAIQRGRKHSAERIEQNRQLRLGNKQSEETKAKRALKLFGNQNAKGHKMTDEHKKIISKANTGRKMPEGALAKAWATRRKVGT